MPKYSKKAQKAISHKMHVMKGEDKPQAQKVAIALSEARSKGLKVPSEKKVGNPAGFHDVLQDMEKQGKDMAIVPKSGEPFHHLPKELKQRKQDFLYHPQMASQKPRIK